MGAQVERRRGEAPQAPRGWSLGRECSPPNGDGEGRGGCCVPSQKLFLTFWLKIVHFGVYSDKNSQFIRHIRF